ncbi:hypothetical protein PV327_010167 [Microctonus hyperodae]|uniref:Uncharacterized protein n=1 Tax=Microctonus hyperodae TaxID=165561 RepID=A0AA39FRB7_MICHY|nr:hypothetical protein PV327_010167 [Microctonus hyperodae]
MDADRTPVFTAAQSNFSPVIPSTTHCDLPVRKTKLHKYSVKVKLRTGDNNAARILITNGETVSSPGEYKLNIEASTRCTSTLSIEAKSSNTIPEEIIEIYISVYQDRLARLNNRPGCFKTGMTMGYCANNKHYNNP